MRSMNMLSVKVAGATRSIQTQPPPSGTIITKFNGGVVPASINPVTGILTVTLAAPPPAGTYLLSLVKANHGKDGQDTTIAQASDPQDKEELAYYRKLFPPAAKTTTK